MLPAVTRVPPETVVAPRALARRDRAIRERAETRQKVLDGARRILREGSMFDMTVQNLVEASSVSRQSIYRHFPATKDIYKALSDEVVSEIYVGLAGLSPSDSGFIPRLVDAAIEVLCRDPKVARVLVLTSAIDRAAGDWIQIDPESLLLAAITAMPATHRPGSRDPKVAARILITYFRGALYGWAAGFLSDSEFEAEIRKAWDLKVK